MAVNDSPIKRKLRTNLDFYHSPTQMRADTWNQLEEYVDRLSEQSLPETDGNADLIDAQALLRTSAA